MLALADQQVRVGIGGRAHVGVAVAHAPAADADLFDGVVVLLKRNGIIIS